MKRIHISEIKVGMVVSKLDKQGVHFPYYGQELINLDFIENLRNEGVQYIYIAEPADSLSFLENLEYSLSNFMRPPCRAESPDDEDDEKNRPGVFSPGNNLFYAKKVRRRIHKNVVGIFSSVVSGQLPNIDIAKDSIKELVNTCLYKNEVFMNMLVIKEVMECEVNHAINVSILSIALGRRLGLPVSDLINLGLAGLLHDVGLLAMPESLFKDSSKLTEGERETVKTHPEKSFELLKKCGGLSESVLQAVLQHHEKADGTGYPEGLTERQITKLAKVVSIADTYDTLTAERPYSRRCTPVQAIKLIFGWSGKLFNETLVKFFVSLVGVYPVGSILRLDSGETGIVYEVSRGSSATPKILIILDKNGKETEPVPFDLNTRNLHTGQPLKIIKEVVDEDGITTDIFSVLEKYFFSGNKYIEK